MFVNIVKFPPIRSGKDVEFQEWFAATNEEFAKYKGFIRRRLLKPLKGGGYVGLVEHETYETFMAMHNSLTRAEARKQVDPLFEGNPAPEFYEVVIE